MKKKIWLIPLALLLIASLVACAAPAPTPTTAPAPAPTTTVTGPATTVTAPAPAPEPEVFNWKWQNLQNASNPSNLPGGVRYRFIDRVRVASNGRLNISFHVGNELVPNNEASDAVANGVIQMATTAGNYFTGKIDVANIAGGIFAAPFVLESAQEKDLLLQYGLKDILLEGYAEHGLYYLGHDSYAPFTFWSTKPMYTLEDMQGLKIRMPGAFGKVMAKVGAAPLSIPLSEAYTAVATGVADAAGMGSIQFESNSFYEICKYFYVPYMGASGLMEVIIDMDAWNALPDDLKAILQTAQVEESKENFLGEMKMLDEMLAKFDDWGVTTITLSDEDVATLREAGTSLMDEIAAISPRMAKAVELTQNYQRLLGYID